MSEATEGMPAPAISVRRVQKASDQIVLQLRDLILSGDLKPGVRLPTELALAQQFGVSRATIREALQALSTERLTRTKRGVNGGTYITMPSADHVTDALSFGVTRLSQTNDVTLDELLAVREFLEIPASRLAARCRTEDDIERLRAAVPDAPVALSVTEQFVQNRNFHGMILEASHNTLLSIAAQPLFTVLQSRLARSALGADFHQAINDQHRDIAAAVVAGDEKRAEELMASHLHWLRPHHERVWRGGGGEARHGD